MSFKENKIITQHLIVHSEKVLYCKKTKCNTPYFVSKSKLKVLFECHQYTSKLLENSV